MTILVDALRKKYRHPKDALRALGLDESLLKTENGNMKTTRFAARTLMLTASTLAPLMAMDAKPVELPKNLFAELTPKNFAEKRPALIAALKTATKGRLAQDADIAQVVDLLQMLDGSKVSGVDEPASEPEIAGMEKAANVAAPAGNEFSNDAEGLGSFLKSKGMDEADIKTACDMFPKAAVDADPDSDEEKKKREDAEKAAKDSADKLAKANDEMKDMVKKPAMDEAIKSAVEGERKRGAAIRVAIDKVRPYVGELPADLALDGAEAVYRHAAVALSIPNAKTIHESALPTLIEMQPKVGARQVERKSHLAMDEDTRSEAVKIAPGIAHIRVGA